MNKRTQQQQQQQVVEEGEGDNATTTTTMPQRRSDTAACTITPPCTALKSQSPASAGGAEDEDDDASVSSTTSGSSIASSSSSSSSLPPAAPDSAAAAAIPTRIDIEEAIDRIGNGYFQKRILVTAGLCFGADAGEVMLLAFLTTVLRGFWDLAAGQSATVVSSVFAGQILGTLVWGPLGDRWGRRPTFLMSAAMVTVFGFVTAASDSYVELIVFRLLTGFGIGGATIPFDLLAEFLPGRSRGKTLVYLGYLYTLGALLVVFFAYITLGVSGDATTNPNGWRYFVALAAIPILVSWVSAIFFVPESPRWLLSQGRPDAALRVLRWAADCNGRDSDELFPVGTVISLTAAAPSAAAGASSSQSTSTGTGTTGKEEEEEGNNRESSNVLDLFARNWRTTTLRLWIAWMSFSFAAAGVVMFSTQVFSNMGISSSASTSSSSASTSRSTTDDSTYYSFNYLPIFIGDVGELLGITLVVFTVDRMGRIPSQIMAYLLGGLMVLGLGLTANYGLSTAVQTFFAFTSLMFLFGGTIVTWTYTAELLPTRLRTTGHASANLVGKVGIAVSPYLVYGNVSDAVKGAVVFGVCLVAVAAVCTLPETNGKALGGVGPDAVAATERARIDGASNIESGGPIQQEDDQEGMEVVPL